MKERPILFSAPMVRAIIEGRKTQTRREMRTQPPADDYVMTTLACSTSRDDKQHIGAQHWAKIDGVQMVDGKQPYFRCPYGKPGDRLRVKEAAWVWCRKVANGKTATGRQKYAYRQHGGFEDGSVIYAADQPAKPERTAYAEPDMVWCYKHARYMPKHLSRITLEITDVRVERLQDISFDDAKAEGCNPPEVRQFSLYGADATGRKKIYDIHAQLGFQPVWNSINGEGAWDKNPWVWALTFKRLTV